MIAIKNGKVVTVTDKTFEHGTVLIEDGKILAVGENIEIPSDAQVIDASGCWLSLLTIFPLRYIFVLPQYPR